MASDVFGIVGTTVVGAFQVEAVVAEGGFAVVYRAYHAGFRARVALKCLKIPQYLSQEEQLKFEEQFQAEAELLFKLSASIPTVVRPLHVEAVVAPDGSFMPFLALEWLDGETLDSVARGRRAAGHPFTLSELILLLTPVARALERAHNFEGPDGPMSIVHRDMKPENVFVAKVAGESVVKILDFGIGKAKSVASQVAGRMSQADGGTTSFTPAYGAPEQWTPKRYGQSGPWTDVWGLALTMTELLAGRAVIDGDHAAMMGTALDPERRPTPRTEGVRVSDAVEAVFERALAVDPRARFGDAGEFWNALIEAHAPGGDRQLEWPGPQARSVGRSGTYPAPGAEGLGRHNLIPDLGGSSGALRSLEFDLGELGSHPAPGTEMSWPTPSNATDSSPPLGTTGPRRDTVARGPVPARAFTPSSLPPPLRMPISLPPRSGDLVRRFLLPAAMVAAGILITLTDEAYAASNGAVFTLGPIRLAWLAAAAVVGGIGLAVYRMVGPGRD